MSVSIEVRGNDEDPTPLTAAALIFEEAYLISNALYKGILLSSAVKSLLLFV